MSRIHTDRSQSGFTLVELAIVMIIIGLLIGGVLKGQELIKNAQITSTVAQIKGIDGATSSFRDMFNAVPGDMANETARLPGCTAAPCAAGGDGNGVLSNAPDAASAAEAQGYFVQLAVADLMTGVDPVAACGNWGTCFPEAKAGTGAGIQVGFFGGGAALGHSAGNATRGHYLTIQTGPTGAPGTTAGAEALTPNQAFRIDSKIDDGIPTSGSVLGGGAAACISGTIYDETVNDGNCNLFIRIQG